MNAVDTNVLIYVNDSRDLRKQAIAAQVVKDLDAGVLLWQVVCEFLAASRKLAPFGFGATEAWDYLQRLCNAWQVIFPTWKVQTRAYELTQRYSISYWMLYCSAPARTQELQGCIPRISIRTTGSTGWRSSIRFVL
jgi:predicted nucleic acid-binding protein